MEFKDLFSVLKKRMSDGDDVPYFFREIISMITDVQKKNGALQKIRLQNGQKQKH